MNNFYFRFPRMLL